jgi:transcriptional regulator with PAS, ATPase and Fis domain
MSPRAKGPLVAVNCGALPDNLLESELFGHVKGAFTDAKHSREGRFQTAEGGTVFLDEIGDAPLSIQVKLLRVLETREVQPLGSDETIKVDVRVVAATNKDLARLVAEEQFREDLFYRLNVILIQIPDLNERKEDIPLLVDHFVGRFNMRSGRSIQGLSDEAMAILMRYDFPGNVRELENIIEHAYIISDGPYIESGHLPTLTLSTSREERGRTSRRPIFPSLTGRLRADQEKQILIEALERNFWNIPRASRELGIHRTTLWRKVKRYGIEFP